MSDEALIRLENLKKTGLTPTQLSERVGSSYQYWRDLLRGQKSFGEKIARKIEDSLQLTRGQLDLINAFEGRDFVITHPIGAGKTGTGSRVIQTILEVKSTDRGASEPEEFVIPQFDTGGAMGSGLLLRDQPGVIKGWSVNQEWISKNIKSHTGVANLCIVTGFGDSMKGMFNSGDPLVVDRGVTAVEYDAVYFFRVADEGFIKRLQRIPGEGLRVLSENTKYETWTIKPDMDFEVFGRVLKAWQGEDF